MLGCAIRARLVFIEYCLSTPVFDRVHGELIHWRRRDAQRANARCLPERCLGGNSGSGRGARDVVLTNMRNSNNTNKRAAAPEDVSIELREAGEAQAQGQEGAWTERPHAQTQGEMRIKLSNQQNSRQLKKPLLTEQDVADPDT